jgi:penicillin amidase
MNFVYADVKGNIGLIGAGYFPIVSSQEKPWLPMDGTGEGDISGRIPYEQIPRIYNPSNHWIATANQPQVDNQFPYYIGTTLYFDSGARADRIGELLQGKHNLTINDMQKMQLDVVDPVFSKVLPKLLEALSGDDLSELEQQVLVSLKDWQGEMNGDSSSAATWWHFWDDYVHFTFDPWWEKYQVPANKGRVPIGVSSNNPSLEQDLINWTLKDPQNAFFSNPISGESHDSKDLMRKSFHNTVHDLAEKFGSDSSVWRWDKLHTRNYPALTGLKALGYGPYGDGGDQHTINAAPSLKSKHGPTWRMITDWGDGTTIGQYPGGQSENPLSPWYKDRFPDWWQGQYKSLFNFEETNNVKKQVRWHLVH